MKKWFSLFSVIILLIPVFIFNSVNAGSKTLGQLLNELDALEVNLKSLSEEKKLTEQRLNEITNNMVKIGLQINEIEDNIISSQNEIEKLKEEIDKKNTQIRTLVSLMQKENNDIMYLEFLFGADTLKNFIYRMKAIEQITAYNEKLVKDMHTMIEEEKQKEKELNKQKEELQKENEKLNNEQQELGLKLNVLDEDARDVLEDISAARTTIKNYQRMGCELNDTIETCSQIPTDTSFIRPLNQGVVTSGYGVRDNPVTGGYQFHAAVDIGGNPTGTSVYATANGTVVLAYYTPNPDIPNSSCGGNFVVIQHQIDGKYYASRYMHLNKIYVEVGQKVTPNDIIGAVGGGEKYDRCTTGPHLDFSIANGIYGKDFYMFRQPATINPYTLINLPNKGIYFTGRYIKY